MPSSKEDDTAAAAEQLLGSISLGGSAERKDNDAKASNGTAAAAVVAKKMCSACGKESDALKKCNGCLCVWYCDKDCQNRHRKEHKVECRRIKKELDKRGGKLDLGNEKDIGPLPDLPPREECPICMHALPIHEGLQIYYECCGKTLCGGCHFQHKMKGQNPPTCAFCRTELPQSDEELLARTLKRIERKDPIALFTLAMYYSDGGLGLPVDQAKYINLLRQSAALGCPSASNQLGNFHKFGKMGLEQNEKEAVKYLTEAAEGGHIYARCSLGHTEGTNGDVVAGLRHWRLSASGGCRRSMDLLTGCFEVGLLHYDDLAEVMLFFYRSRAELRSDDRDKFIEYMKRNGDYTEVYDL